MISRWFTRFASCLAMTGLLFCATAKTVQSQETGPFNSLPVDAKTAAIRQAFLEGDFAQASKLLDESPQDLPAHRAIRFGMRVAKTELADPLSEVMHNHDFAGGELAAFIPNGKEDPVVAITRDAQAMIDADPASASHVADALCVAVGLQLMKAIKQEGYIALDDDILFSREVHSNLQRELFNSLALEVFNSKEEARKSQQELIRVMYLQMLRPMEQTPLMRSGIWIRVKQLAAKLDQDSVERWRPIYIDLARQCSAKGRYTSGTLIVINGGHLGADGGWLYLREVAAELAKNPDKRHVTNFKIAFAYLCEALKTMEMALPSNDDEAFRDVREAVSKLGDANETKYAFQAAGLPANP